jgi:geranylgeranyl diphosphate synthase type II
MQKPAITQFGHGLSLAFQVIDDILDLTQTSEILGKSAGKDVAAKKSDLSGGHRSGEIARRSQAAYPPGP